MLATRAINQLAGLVGLKVSKRPARDASDPPPPELERRHVGSCSVLENRLALLDKLPKSGHVAEIGVNRGDFSAEILARTSPKALELIDTWDSVRYPKYLQETVTERFSEEIESGIVHVKREDSVEAADLFLDGQLDWIYLDTSHSYEGTRRELDAWASKVKDNGIIAGDDFQKGNITKCLPYGVIRAVNEFVVRRDWEFLHITMGVPNFAIRRRA